MTFYVIVPPGKDRLAEVSKIDIGFVSPGAQVELINVDDIPLSQLNAIASLNLESGDVVCFAGLCVRRTTLDVIELAKNNKLNYMPGAGVDHRGVELLGIVLRFQAQGIFLHALRAEVVAQAADANHQGVVVNVLRGRHGPTILVQVGRKLDGLVDAVQALEFTDAKGEVIPMGLGHVVDFVVSRIHATGRNFM